MPVKRSLALFAYGIQYRKKIISKRIGVDIVLKMVEKRLVFDCVFNPEPGAHNMSTFLDYLGTFFCLIGTMLFLAL